MSEISPILWQNSNRTVTLLDIPHSISSAQGHRAGNLISSLPLLSPFPSNEPKSASAKAKLEKNTADSNLHAEYVSLLRQALEEVTRHHDGDWCLSRTHVEEAPRATKRRRSEDNQTGKKNTPRLGTDSTLDSLPDGLLTSLALESDSTSQHHLANLVYRPDENTPSSQSNEPISDPQQTHFLTNPTNHPATLTITPTHTKETYTFHIPPQSTFSLSPCTSTLPFHASLRNQSSQTNTRKHFDFILLDPPWPNRSVKRTHCTPGSTYTVSPSLRDLRGLLLGTDLDVVMAEDCLVGIWTTNKPGVRELVLGEEDGLFACWGVQLVEEWVWLKTTLRGEPVIPLDGVWRKPYEVLLLGRKRRGDMWGLEGEDGREVKRRVVVGVPDLHSRKPCLKALIEPMMSDRKDYRALEVFARYLVAGWWSWGDECIKFNWDGCWREAVTRLGGKGER